MCPIISAISYCPRTGASSQRDRRVHRTYHSLLSEEADLLDGTRSSLLEADAVNLYTNTLLDICSCLSLPSDAQAKASCEDKCINHPWTSSN